MQAVAQSKQAKRFERDFLDDLKLPDVNTDGRTAITIPKT